ncbi:MAG: aldo/keto reductase [Erysipelotrichia bacterium]|nr:aldo/keto reductase [Erysipelotrichia bacterium]
MLYKQFADIKLSQLGFGTMRLPMTDDGDVDQEKTQELIDYALKNGINYFDTAYPYCQGKSEIVIGESLKKYPRNSFYLADKYPGHQLASSYNPQDIFEKQLKKCQVDYFDFYLLHNVCEQSLDVYEDERWHIIPYFLEQKRLGRIKYLGFSTHATVDTLRYFIEKYGNIMDFCQIQLNYLDWTLQQAKEKYELLCQHNIPVWVMEPLRGGKLVNITEGQLKRLQDSGLTNAQTAAFDFLKSLDNVTVVLSGMNELSQMEENITIFSRQEALTSAQREILFNIAEQLKQGEPCTGCRYCCEGCPAELNIPQLINCYNDLIYSKSFTPIMYLEHLPQDKLPTACLGCGQCSAVCPQKIDVPQVLQKLTVMYEKSEKWHDICKKREQDARKLG